MARCRCSTEACTCQIVGGPGVAVVGVGSSSSPYVITSQPDSSGTIQFQDTPSVDFDVTGFGTLADPIIVRAAAVIGPNLRFDDSADIDVTVTGTGTQADPLVVTLDMKCIQCGLPGRIGDVLTLQADGTYAPGPPAQTAPGAISVSTGIAGDGTGANPLRVDLCTYADLKGVCVTP